MKKLRWQLLVVLLALIAIGVLLYGQQPTIVPGLAPVVRPAQGGIYTEALVGSFGRLNPALDYYNQPDHDLDRLLFSGLLRFGDRGLPQGDLAKDWASSLDGKSYTFALQPNATWHDGKPVTSDDVVFTIELMRSDSLPIPEDLRTFWKQIQVTALDPKTLQFVLPEPFAPFLDYLTFGVLPKHLLNGTSPESLINSAFNLKPIGSGPYRFDHLITENGQIQGVALVLYKEYYGNKPYIEQIVFKYFDDQQTALEAYRKNDVLGISQVSDTILPGALKESNLGIYTGRLPRLALIYLNLSNPQLAFFKDPALRRALLMGLNRQWMIDHLLNGQAVLADGPILPGTWAYYDKIEHINYDPAAATAALKKAGYAIPAAGGSVRAKDNVPLSFELAFPDQAPYPDLAGVVQASWQNLGVQVSLKPVPYDQLISDYLEARTYQAVLVDLNMARSPDPDPYPFWHQAQINGGQNYAGWDDRQASEFLEQARVQTDINERARRYRNFQVRFTSEMPALPLFYPMYSYGVDKQVLGIRIGPLFDSSDRFTNITAWYLVTKKSLVGSASKP